MSQILVRNLAPDTVEKLKQQAKRNNRSLEAEVRTILDQAAHPFLAPEYADYLNDIANGRNRNLAFRDYVERTRVRSRPSSPDSVDLIREAREELDAKWR